MPRFRSAPTHACSDAWARDRRRWLFVLGGALAWRYRPGLLTWPLTRGLRTAHSLGRGSTRALLGVARRSVWWAWRRR